MTVSNKLQISGKQLLAKKKKKSEYKYMGTSVSWMNFKWTSNFISTRF